MANPATGFKKFTLQVNPFSRARTLLPAGTEVLVTLRNGNQQNVALPNNGFFTEPSITIEGLPFFNNFGDKYAVIASADDYEQAGFHPVSTDPMRTTIV